MHLNRRQLLGLAVSSRLGLARAAAPSARDEVATPAARAEYLRRLLIELCAKPRPSGSKAHEAGAAIIERELRRSMPVVSRDKLTFRQWTAVGDASLTVSGQKVETYLGDFSPSTPVGGARGVLQRKDNGAFEVVDSQSRRVVARIGISEFGRAIVNSNRMNDEVPLFNVGRQDVEMLERAVRDGTAVEARGKAKWIPNVKTSNVSATLPGESKDEILVIAHADTKYNTPGAHDNTASVITMIMLAHAASATKPKRTLSFLASTGEEIGYLGAKHYAQMRRDQGTLGNIKVCVNLDSLTYGPNLQINTTDAQLSRMILDIHKDVGVRTEPKAFHQNDTMDSSPFLAAGARTVHLNSRGDDARTLPLWHRPEDTADTIKPEFAESSFLVLQELLRKL